MLCHRPGVLWGRHDVTPAGSVVVDGESARDRATAQPRFSSECERWLDHWYRGSAQKARLKELYARRAGAVEEPRGGDPLAGDWAGERHLNDDGREIATESTELVTFGYARNLAESLGVLYDSDDLERVYTAPNGKRDEQTTRTMAWYHSPAHGGLEAWLHLIDAWLPGLRTCHLLTEWCEDLGELSYAVLPPHWVTWWPRPDRPTETRLAYAVAYSEPEVIGEDGRPQPAKAWTVYVRPALPGDPEDAPTREPGFERTGRLVRYKKSNSTLSSSPWPIPPPEDPAILKDPSTPTGLADGPNPLVAAGGMKGTSRVWCPLVLHTSEPLVDGMRLPVADDQCQLAEELDYSLTTVLHVANLQSHGVLVKIGAGDLPDRVGPQNPIELQEGGDAKFIAPNGDPERHARVAHTLAKIAGVFEHLPPDTWDFDPPSIETGPAKQLRRAALIAHRSRRTVDAERPEQRRWELERLLHNRHGVTPQRPRIPDSTTMHVDWGELATPVNWSQRLQEMQQELSLGITQLVELIMERHGVDRAEAERRLRAAQPSGEDGESQGPSDLEQAQAVLGVLEQLVKAGSPQEANRELARKAFGTLGIDTPEVRKALDDAFFRWYTQPPEDSPKEGTTGLSEEEGTEDEADNSDPTPRRPGTPSDEQGSSLPVRSRRREEI